MISLVAGKPNPETFPFAEIAITLKGPAGTKIVLDEADLNVGLQYGLPAGNGELIKVCFSLRTFLSRAEN
jgi:tryptophan aminotransferase